MLQAVAEPSTLPQRILWRRLRAAIASGLGENAAAADEMRAALALEPSEPALLLPAAAAEFAAGQWDSALQHAREAGKTGAAEELIGDIQEKRGDFVEAAKAYQEAVALAPDREEYRIALALELVQHQTFLPAIAVLEQAVPLFPKSARIRTLLGIAHYALGNNDQAIAALTGAIRVDPKLQQAYLYLSKILLDSSAAPPADALDAICGRNETICAAMKLRLARERNDKALQAEATAVLRRAPESVVTHCELARSYEWSGRWHDARTEMERCIALQPSPQNHYRMALIYKQLGLQGLAREQLKLRAKALQEISDESARRADATKGFEYVIQ